MDINELSGRDLDAEIVKTVLQWKLTKIPKDYYGKNECEVFTPDGDLMKCLNGLQLPPAGKLHLGYFAPYYHRDLEKIVLLYRRLDKADIVIKGNLRTLPTKLCRELLIEYQSCSAPPPIPPRTPIKRPWTKIGHGY